MTRYITILLAVLCIAAQSFAQTPHLNANSFLLVDPSSGFTLTINPGTLTANQILTFPNVSGTLMTNPNNGTFPNQTGNAGKFLTTDGSILSWATTGGASGPAGGDLTGTYPNPFIANSAVTSAKILDGTIVNADISPTAAISYSKVNLTGSISGSDIAAGTFTTTNAHHAIGNSDNTARELRLLEPSGSGVNYTAFKAQAQAGNLTYTLPGAQGAAGTVLTNDGTGVLSWATAGGGGLTNFTESVNTAAPNATVPVVQLLATNAAANVDVALSAKGTGALTAQVADNTAAGGNKRGQYAVDWQMYRGVNTQVASGSYATVGGGSGNTASGLYATVGGGTTNTASGYASIVSGGTTNTASVSRTTVGGGDGNTASAFYATVGGGFKNVANNSEATVGGGGINTASGNSSMVGGGFGNIASSNYGTVGGGSNNTASSADNATVGGGNTNTSSGYSSVVGGGYSNWASAWSSTVGGGYTNTASALYSSIPGGYQALASNYGQMAQAAGNFAVQGDAQTSVFVARNQTTNAVATSLFLDGGSLLIAIPTNGAMTFKVTIVGKITGQTATVGGWEIIGAISNNGVGTTAIIGANITRTINTPAGWGVPTVTNNGQNMDIQVTGKAATTIDWVARVETVEVVF